MKHFFSIVLLSSILICSCGPGSDPKEKVGKAELEDQILEVEQAFYKECKEKGLAQAFVSFADTNAVLHRNGKLYKGKEQIAAFFADQDIPEGAKLSWAPSHVHVAEAGDLAYTYGKFVYSYPNDSGTIQSNDGYFQTVWKRQEDGSWKYVWD